MSTLSVNLFGWLCTEKGWVTAKQQHAFHDLVEDAPSRLWALAFTQEGRTWTANGHGGRYIIESRPGDLDDHSDPMHVETRVEKDGEVTALNAWTSRRDEADDGDSALMYASILEHEAKARGLDLRTLLDAHEPRLPLPDDLERCRPGASNDGASDPDGFEPF